MKLDPESMYLFLSGLGSLGRSLAQEYVASGAQNIAFLSRSGDTTAQAKAVIDELAGGGVQAKGYIGDIFERPSLLAAIK